MHKPRAQGSGQTGDTGFCTHWPWVTAQGEKRKVGRGGGPVAPVTFSSPAGKGEPAKGPTRQPKSQQSVVTWEPAGETLEEGGRGWLCQTPPEGDWGDRMGKLQDRIFRKILMCSRPFLFPIKIHYDSFIMIVKCVDQF